MRGVSGFQSHLLHARCCMEVSEEEPGLWSFQRGGAVVLRWMALGSGKEIGGGFGAGT